MEGVGGRGVRVVRAVTGWAGLNHFSQRRGGRGEAGAKGWNRGAGEGLGVCTDPALCFAGCTGSGVFIDAAYAQAGTTEFLIFECSHSFSIRIFLKIWLARYFIIEFLENIPKNRFLFF